MMTTTTSPHSNNHNTIDTVNPQNGAGRLLPKKESDIFKSVMKLYESKQYKKALKQADAILKRFPQHGETLAMKGLTINSMHHTKKKEEAIAFVRQGIQNDMRSPVCWHVFGLIHRSHHDYNQAMRCYKQALSMTEQALAQTTAASSPPPTNHHNQLSILRDLSHLQLQLRDLPGYVRTRHTMLQCKPNAPLHWLAYLVGRQLTATTTTTGCSSSSSEAVVDVMERYESAFAPPAAGTAAASFETSELAMYKNDLLLLGTTTTNTNDNDTEAAAAAQQQQYQAAYDHICTCESVVVDRGAWLWRKAVLAWQLGRMTEARTTLVALWSRGATEEYRTHALFMCVVLEWPWEPEFGAAVLGWKGTRTVADGCVVTPAQRDTLAAAYAEHATEFATSTAITSRIPLLLSSSPEEFQRRCGDIAMAALRKGVPSLCAEMASLLWIPPSNTNSTTTSSGRSMLVRATDPVDVREHSRYQLYCRLVDGWLGELNNSQRFTSDGESPVETEQTIFWTKYLRASLHELAGEYAEGLALIDSGTDAAVDDTDVYELRARMLRSSGRLSDAVLCLQAACEADKSDRYLNNMCTKYLLQANREEEALKMIGLFSRHEGAVEQNLYDMQCSWYELEIGACFERKKEFGKSLKQFAAVAKHFDDFQEDQFDFHAYCLRKVTLRAYISVLRYEDNVYGHEYFCEAAEGLVRIYLHLFDNPSVAETKEPDYSSMTAAERKKAKAIARKKKNASEKKLAQRQGQSADQNGGNKKKGANDKPHPIDEDPLGLQLLGKDPLEEAKKYSIMLSRYAPMNAQTWLCQYDVAIRRNKPLLALQALWKLKRIDPGNGGLLARTVNFVGRRTAQEDSAKVSAPALQILEESTLSLIAPAASLEDFIRSEASRVRGNPNTELPVRIAVARLWRDQKMGSLSESVDLMAKGWESFKEVSVDTCRDALQFLQEIDEKEMPESGKVFAQTIKERFPDAAV